MRRVLIVSPHFPPTNAPDHLRVRMSLPYYRDYGWDPVVLAVDADDVPAPADPLLAATIPDDLAVHRVHASRSPWLRRLGVGSLGYRAWFPLRSAGDRLLRESPFDLVYFSTTQFLLTMLGPRWHAEFGVPYVIDVQDPWRTDYYERPGAPPPPGGWKYRVARWQAEHLEERAWAEAAGFVSVSEAYVQQLAARYPWFSARPWAVVPFGAPQQDFDLARQRQDLVPAFVREPGCLHVVSVGAVGPIMRTSLELLFAAVRELRTRHPEDVARLRFDFIGTSYAPADQARPSVAPLAEAAGVGDLVREAPGRIGYFTAIRTLLAADAIVIPGSDDAGYSPSKIATCFLADKPTLALTPAGSALDRMVTSLAFATVARWPEPAATTAAADFLIALLVNPHPTRHPSRNWEKFSAEHTARARTRQQCELFDRAVNARPA